MRLFRRAVEMSPLEISRSARVRSQRSPRQFLLAKWVSSGLVSTATDARVKIAARMTSIYRASVKSAQLTEDRPTPSADAIASRPFPCSRRVRARPARSGVMTVGRPGAGHAGGPLRGRHGCVRRSCGVLFERARPWSGRGILRLRWWSRILL